MSTRFAEQRETKIFDPRDPSTGTAGAELLDSTIVQRSNQWWMFLAGQAQGYGAPQLYSASLPPGAPLSATGWNLTRTPDGKLAPLAPQQASAPWDANGGRHCPSWVRGWDPHRQQWVERIYYAGGAQNVWGPYTIGFLEWDGERWIDQPEPAFTATEDWEHGSVYEPNLIYHDGRWKLWYVAGSNHENYVVHGYAESVDGCSGWSQHSIFARAETKMFDFCVRERPGGFDAVFARVWLAGSAAPPETGLWWCRSANPSGNLSDWGEPVQIMTAEDRGWHSGPWKPSLAFPGPAGNRAFVFFDGLYRTFDPGPFPFAFTLGCLEIDLPG
ncbi:MAG TPA: hypothetical protein VKT75_04775 [Acidobacteriaceae bacterium]|nr:hypothetical protein [Acidobacteriaceae bacterium]